MLLTKGSFHQLVAFSDANSISQEVIEKLTQLEHLFDQSEKSI